MTIPEPHPRSRLDNLSSVSIYWTTLDFKALADYVMNLFYELCLLTSSDLSQYSFALGSGEQPSHETGTACTDLESLSRRWWSHSQGGSRHCDEDGVPSYVLYQLPCLRLKLVMIIKVFALTALKIVYVLKCRINIHAFLIWGDIYFNKHCKYMVLWIVMANMRKYAISQQSISTEHWLLQSITWHC